MPTMCRKIQNQSESSSRKGLSQPMGIRIVAGFMVPWEPLFVKCHGGSPDTGTGEDEFSHSEQEPSDSLIPRVLMMNFFLFILFIFTLMPPPTAL